MWFILGFGDKKKKKVSSHTLYGIFYYALQSQVNATRWLFQFTAPFQLLLVLAEDASWL